MKKNKAQKDILYISISIFVVTVIWVASNLYHAHVTSTITPDLQIQIVPIDPNFNTDIIQKIKNRKRVAPLFEVKNSSSEASLTDQSASPTQTSTSPGAQGIQNLIQKPTQ